MSNQIQLPKDPRLAGQLLQSHAATQAAKVKRGAIGWLFGMGTEKPGNIGVFAFGVAAALFLVVLFSPAVPDFPKSEALLTFGGIMTTALGFIFGRVTAEP